MTERLPDDLRGPSAGPGDRNVNVQIDNLHLQANDLDALRRLSEVDPELARDVLRQRDRINEREHVSDRMGMAAALVMGLALLVVVALGLFKLGFWLSVVLVLLLLGAGHFLRVVLTGEWSDTSWFGSFLSSRFGKKDDEEA